MINDEIKPGHCCINFFCRDMEHIVATLDELISYYPKKAELKSKLIEFEAQWLYLKQELLKLHEN